MTFVLAGTVSTSALQSWTLGPVTTFSRVGKWLERSQSQDLRHQYQRRTFKTRQKVEHPYSPRSPRKSPRRSPRPSKKTPWAVNTSDNFQNHYSTLSNNENANSGLAFGLAAASCGKGRHFSQPENIYPFDPTTQDHIGVEKAKLIRERKLYRRNSGQDAFFMSKISNHSDTVAFGIADGVGGWADRGVDPADFSHGLCSQMALSAFAWPDSEGNLYPGHLMTLGYMAVLKDRGIRAGGSTACVGCVNSHGRLQMANLGDSGFLLLRTGRAHYYSNPQTHGFNTPYQLSIVPPKFLTQASVFGGGPHADTPGHSDLSEDTVQDGDVLILATDGVWDNLNSQDLLNIVKSKMFDSGAWVSTSNDGIVVSEKLAELMHLNPSPSGFKEEVPDLRSALQSALAASIVSAARIASLDPRHDGPFAKEVQKVYPQDGWRGGKVDDICVIVLVAVGRKRAREAAAPKQKQKRKQKRTLMPANGRGESGKGVDEDPMDIDEPAERK